MTAKTVLVVDDEAHIAHVVSLKLAQAGLRVVTASDGEEGLAAAKRERPDLIVSDLQMPILNGLDMAIMLRDDPQTRDIPVLMVTARGHLIPQEELDRTNIRAVMCKPFGPRHLLEKVQQVLPGSGRRDADGSGGAERSPVAA